VHADDGPRCSAAALFMIAVLALANRSALKRHFCTLAHTHNQRTLLTAGVICKRTRIAGGWWHQLTDQAFPNRAKVMRLFTETTAHAYFISIKYVKLNVAVN